MGTALPFIPSFSYRLHTGISGVAARSKPIGDFLPPFWIKFQGGARQSLRARQVRLIKIGAKVVKHACYTCFQMAEA